MNYIHNTVNQYVVSVILPGLKSTKVLILERDFAGKSIILRALLYPVLHFEDTLGKLTSYLLKTIQL